MIIKDIKGGTLSLTKTRLTERAGGQGKYYLDLVDLQDGETIHIQQVEGKNYNSKLMHSLRVETGKYYFAPFDLRIGCRSFSKEVYAQIMKAAEAARKAAAKKAERKNG